jgi:hypothetical protein
VRAGQDQPEISWNTWLEDSLGKDVPLLALDKVYRINLDLARYAYREKWSAASSSGLIKKLRDHGEIRLLLQPVLLGGNLCAPGRIQVAKPDHKINRANSYPPTGLRSQEFGRHTVHKRSCEASISARSHRGSVANQPGCLGIAISVWDEARHASRPYRVFLCGAGMAEYQVQI